MIKLLQVSNAVALFVTIIINYLSNTGNFNGNTISTISAKYENYFTPAGYAFSIWIVIYISLISFVIYQSINFDRKIKSSEVVSQIGWWFVISCMANCLWVFAWIYEYTGLSVLVMMVLLFSLFKIIVKTNMEMYDAPLREIIFVWWPFSMYSGWITVALFANISTFLTKIGWENFPISQVSLTIIMILLAGAIYLLLTWKRNMREYEMVGAWGLAAVGVTNVHDQKLIAWIAFTVAGILFVSTTVHAYINRKSFPWREI